VGSEGAFFEQFIDDYFAESEEHLATIRRVLLHLEERHSLDPAEGLELARALHTLKGLSGMVGLEPVESAAHAMEDAVSALPSDPDGRSIELLFKGASIIESRIQSRKRGEAVEGTDDYVREVWDALAGQRPREAVSADAAAPPPTLHRVTFAPSRELAERGITIDVVRGRLAARGEIEGAMPRVHPEGGVYFEFTVRTAGPLDEAWRNDGMDWSVVETEPNRALVSVQQSASTAKPSVPSAANLVRVDLGRLDESMRIVGELVISRSRLQDAIDRLAATTGDAALEPIAAAADAIERQLRTLREGIMRIRLVPIGEVFERMRFAMREIAREHGKLVHLDFEGGTTEIDKVVIDRIVEPLMHLVRNAASHGIESPADRQSSGKSPTGHITLRARAAGDRIIVEVEDDGAGINFERVERRARERGLLPARATLEPSAMLDVLAAPGFSTAESTDLASGRGVGMAVVVSTIRGLGGELNVASRPGEGTRFVIELPLTLMIADALLVEIAAQTMAVPQILLREILTLADHRVTILENNQVIPYRDAVLPLIDLRETFGGASTTPGRHVLVVGADGSLQGLIVDRVLGLREIVVQPVSDPYVNVVGVAGATELADGRVCLILDLPAIVRHYRRRGTRPHLVAPRTQAIEGGS
jgi:two-component system chemotaxis sensor kinase CheA